MSESQYYDFRAIDRPLTSTQRAELDKISTRAEISSTSFTNFYTFGDFRGNPVALVERYFDAFLYQPVALGHSAERGWACVRDTVSHRVTPPLGLAMDLPPSLELAPDGMTPMVVWHDAWRGLIPCPVGVEVPDFLGEDFIQPPLTPEAP